MEVVRTLTSIVLLAACAACSVGGGGGGGNPDGGPDQPSDVNGSFLLHDVTDAVGDPAPRPINLPVEVLVPTSGGFQTIAGTSNADGTFNVPLVPPGLFYFKSGTTFFLHTSAHNLDIGQVVLGRANAASITATTNLTFNVGGLSPNWAAGHALGFHATNSGASFTEMEGGGMTPQPTGTSTNNGVVNFRNADNPSVIDTTQGDEAVLTRLESASNGGVTYLRLIQAYKPTPLTLSSGTPATITGTFQAVTQNGNVNVDWKRSQFAGEQARAHPAAVLDPSRPFTLALVARPPQYPVAVNTLLPNLALVRAPPGGVTDLPFAMTFGNPFPAHFEPSLNAEVRFLVTYLAPGASTPIDRPFPAVAVDLAVSGTGTQTVAPLVGPPVGPLVNGQDAFQNQTGVGTTPTLSWQAPAIGTATGYQVRFRRLYNNAGASSVEILPQVIYTAETSVQVPPGILIAGESYYLRIFAVNNGGFDFRSAPRRRQLPAGEASLQTAVITP
jgi:hypothetical protein